MIVYQRSSSITLNYKVSKLIVIYELDSMLKQPDAKLGKHFPGPRGGKAQCVRYLTGADPCDRRIVGLAERTHRRRFPPVAHCGWFS